MTNQNMFDDLNLLAYADGLLDDTPEAKANVEQRLREDPEAAERMRIYQAQTEAMRREYAAVITAPVPEKLYAALEIPSEARSWPPVAGIAAAVVFAVMAGGTGWMLGESSSSSEFATDRFLEQSYLNYTQGGSSLNAGQNAGDSVMNVNWPSEMNWLSDEVSITLRAPDLSAQGYSIVDNQIIHADGERMARLTYAKEDGSEFSLFLRPRWESRNAVPQVSRTGDVSLAYWLDGPLASAVASRLEPSETLAIAETVQRAMHSAGKSKPSMKTAPVPESPGEPIQTEAGLVNGLLGPHQSPAAPHDVHPAQKINSSTVEGVTSN